MFIVYKRQVAMAVDDNININGHYFSNLDATDCIRHREPSVRCVLVGDWPDLGTSVVLK